MKKIAFLTCSNLDGFVADDQLLAQELESQGQYKVSNIPWDAPTDWQEFDVVIIRTTWDYYKRLNEFLETLRHISSLTRLINSVDVVQWNCHKGYLLELENKGVTIVPTVFLKYPCTISIPADWKAEKFIIKPCISASAYKTLVLTREDIREMNFKNELYPGDWMLQPFLDEIKQGEISLHYFNRHFSHAIIKIPKSGDFRVQEEHGGDIQSFKPDSVLLKLGEKIISNITHDIFYARVDLVPFKGTYALMELELIEPALYFRTDPQSEKNFHNEFNKIF